MQLYYMLIVVVVAQDLYIYKRWILLYKLYTFYTWLLKSYKQDMNVHDVIVLVNTVLEVLVGTAREKK